MQKKTANDGFFFLKFTRKLFLRCCCCFYFSLISFKFAKSKWGPSCGGGPLLFFEVMCVEHVCFKCSKLL